jgi:hypothetical protein
MAGKVWSVLRRLRLLVIGFKRKLFGPEGIMDSGMGF